MYHSFLIHSSADGHLGCFHVLAIINSAVMNTGVHVSLSDLISSVCPLCMHAHCVCIHTVYAQHTHWASYCVCPAVELLGHMAVLFPVF